MTQHTFKTSFQLLAQLFQLLSIIDATTAVKKILFFEFKTSDSIKSFYTIKYIKIARNIF